MSSFDPAPESSRAETPAAPEPHRTGSHRSEPHGAGENVAGQGVVADSTADSTARVGTIVWGLVVLNGTYVLIGLMIGAGAALVIGGLLSARRRDNGTTNGKA